MWDVPPDCYSGRGFDLRFGQVSSRFGHNFYGHSLPTADSRRAAWAAPRSSWVNPATSAFPETNHKFSILGQKNGNTCSRSFLRKIGGWMDELGFNVPSTVFQSFRDDGSVNMKGSVQ